MMDVDFTPQPRYWPVLSKVSLNLSSKKAKRFGLLIMYVGVAYLLVFGIYITLSFIREFYPETWKRLTEILTGTNTKVSIKCADSMLRISLFLAGVSIVSAALIALRLIRWQFSLSVLFGISLWSLTYLVCAVILQVKHTLVSHSIELVLASVFFIVIFAKNSLLKFYWKSKCYGDVVLESSILVIFLFFTISELTILVGGKFCEPV